MGLTAIYTESTLISLFKILNVKETLAMAERREEARLVFRITIEVIERSKPHFFIAIPFELRNGKKGLISKRQDSLLDFDRDVGTDIYTKLGGSTFRFSNIENRNIILRNQEKSIYVNIPKNEDFVVYEASFKEFDQTIKNVQSPISLLHVEFSDPIPQGLYFIKFYCYARNFIGKIADYWMFEQGRILESPVWNNIISKEQIIPSHCSEMVFDYLEFFVITPSHVIVSSVAPKDYEGEIFTDVEEAELGGIVDIRDPAEFDYKPYKGRNQFKWIFYPNSKEKFISLTYWSSSAMSILLLFVTLFLNFLGIVFLITAAENLLGITIITFLSILGVFNLLVYFSIRKPKIVQRIFLFLRTAGINQSLNQIYGSGMFFILASLIIYAFRGYSKLAIPATLSLLILIALLITLAIDARWNPDRDLKRFSQVFIYRNITDVMVSLVLSALVLNIYFFRVLPEWTWENSLSFFLMVFSFHVFAGKVSEIHGIRTQKKRSQKESRVG